MRPIKSKNKRKQRTLWDARCCGNCEHLNRVYGIFGICGKYGLRVSVVSVCNNFKREKDV